MKSNTPNLISWKELMAKFPKEATINKVASPMSVVDGMGIEFKAKEQFNGPFMSDSGMAYYYHPAKEQYYCPYHELWTETPIYSIERFALQSDSMEKEAAKKRKGSKKPRGSQKAKPTNSALWSRAKSLARSKFDVYPSAYANGWAARWYKQHGGGWRTTSGKKKSKKK